MDNNQSKLLDCKTIKLEDCFIIKQYDGRLL